MNVLIALSGGVDSAVTAFLLRKAGHRLVAGVTMTRPNGGAPAGAAPVPTPGSPADLAAARHLCDRLGIPHLVIDITAAYRQAVVDPCRGAYRTGYTPNACVLCNPAVKFGFLPEAARCAGINFDAMATGHYARIVSMEEGDGAGIPPAQDAARAEVLAALEALRTTAAPGVVFSVRSFALLCGADAARDQAYFLFRLSTAQLAQTLFPLGALTKTDVRALAQSIGLEVAQKPDSQDLCIDCAELLGNDEKPGEICRLDGSVLGHHRGFWRHTPGQRKGLGLSGFAEPLFVTSLDPEKNRVYVGSSADLVSPSLLVENVVWTSIEPPPVGTVFTCGLKPRSSGVCLTSRIEVLSGNRFLATRPEGFRAPSPGQAAVLYAGSLLLGGGSVSR